MTAKKICGLNEFLVFVTALVGGTLCSLTSKILLTMKGKGLSDKEENFSSPLFQTFGMFLGMSGALVLHFLVVKFKWSFPGYNFEKDKASDDSNKYKKKIPLCMYFMLIVPAAFDIAATSLAMFGLQHVNVSIYQILRGSSIIFIALMKQFVMKHHLAKYKWIGIFYNVLSIVLVGVVAFMSKGSGSSSAESRPLLGVALILSAAFVQSILFVFEEVVMSDSGDLPQIPPLLLIGMEGIWGTAICVFILYPIAYSMHGNDHGSLENPFNTYAIFKNSGAIQAMFALYFFSVLMYNVFALLVTCLLDSVWRAILDNFRPIAVWSLDLAIFYFITRAFGESWTKYCWIQLLGLLILIYGTAIYNAPNSGSIKLTGDCMSCAIDCTEEYAKLAEDKKDDHEAERFIDSKTEQGDRSRNHQYVPTVSAQPHTSTNPIHNMESGQLHSATSNQNYGSIA